MILMETTRVLSSRRFIKSSSHVPNCSVGDFGQNQKLSIVDRFAVYGQYVI